MIKRKIEDKIEDYLINNSHKILFVWGPRRSGKTTILNDLKNRYNYPLYNFDILSDRELFTNNLIDLEKIVRNNKVILIDEVQNYPESTLALKILFDEFNIKIIATGSSELRQTSHDFDSLANRYEQIYCLPLSLEELETNNDYGNKVNEVYKISDESKREERNEITHNKPSQYKDNLKKTIDHFEIFGAYPEIYNINDDDKKIDLLQNILNTYVLKDIIDIYELKNTKLAKDILTKIALQIGNEVSIREISSSLNANVGTVTNYIEIFIKNYILIPLTSFRTNIRKAVSSNKKLYFYDLGIRNILIKDFRELDLRPDKGAVFENLVISEIIKNKLNNNLKFSEYFYREYGGKEIDLIIEDYYKNYLAIDVKLTKGKVQDIFPIEHKSDVITEDSLLDKITELF